MPGPGGCGGVGRGGRAWIPWKLGRLHALRTFRALFARGHSEHLHPFELQGLRASRRLKAVATPRAHGSLGALGAFRALA